MQDYPHCQESPTLTDLEFSGEQPDIDLSYSPVFLVSRPSAVTGRPPSGQGAAGQPVTAGGGTGGIT